ncbi:hypothetical protein L0F63_000346 [Massospora cicadina]|nr:hypothetical protein L0F63_000346 [Massospora cicadina]
MDPARERLKLNREFDRVKGEGNHSRRSASCQVNPTDLEFGIDELPEPKGFEPKPRPRSNSLTGYSSKPTAKELAALSDSFTFEPVQPLELDPDLVESITSRAAMEKPDEARFDVGDPNFSTPETSPSQETKPIHQKRSPNENEFDYTQFLDEIRSPQALPIVRYLENFVREFDKKPWTVRDQVKIVAEFADFVVGKMVDCGLWAGATTDYLNEGVEQYLMNRLHGKAFRPLGSEDRERDHVLHQRVRYFRWVEAKHLDIQLNFHCELLAKAQLELMKLDNFKTPRHKMICILNCCKLLFKLLRRNEQPSSGADSFLPLLILAILKANPPKLISNLQYISRFRHPSRLRSEAGYYLTNLVGAIQFIEGLEPASLTISREEFDANLERTLKELASETPQGLADTPLAQEPFTSSPTLQPNFDTLDKGKKLQLAQRIKRPLDLVGRFLSEVTSPVTPSSSPLTLPPTPPSDKLPKRKTFLGSLFASGGEDAAQQDRELISLDDPSHPPETEGVSPHDEKSPPNPVSDPHPLGPTRLSSTAFDDEVLQAVIGSQRGDLGASVDTLLELAAPDAADLISFPPA